MKLAVIQKTTLIYLKTKKTKLKIIYFDAYHKTSFKFSAMMYESTLKTFQLNFNF